MPKLTLYFGRDGDILHPVGRIGDAKEIAEIKKLLPKKMPLNEHVAVDLPRLK